jgi:tetratricopeptide (TPR) repeat protein
MKRSSILQIVGIALVAMTTQAFQCGSPDFTGAKLYENQQNWKDAVRLYEAETQKNPGNAEAWYRMGRLKGERLDDYDGMNVAFNATSKLTKSFDTEIRVLRYNRWATHVNAGVECLRKGSSDSLAYFDKSVEEFKKASTVWPDTGVTYKFLGHAYLSKKDNDNAVASYTKAWAIDKDMESYKTVGRIFVARGMELKGKFESDNAEALKSVRNVTEVEKGLYRNDIMRMFGAPDNVKKGPKSSKKEDWSYTKYNLVLTLEGDKVIDKKMTKPYTPAIDSTTYQASLVEFGRAVEVYEKIKATDPKDNENLNLLLQAYVESNRIAEAKEAFKQAVINEPTNKTNHYILGVLFRTTGDFNGAIASFGEAIRIDPEYTEALFDIGATYYNWGVDMLREAQDKGSEDVSYKEKFKLALPNLEKVAEKKKDDPSVWETLGTIYARLGQSDKAMKALDEADRIRRGK